MTDSPPSLPQQLAFARFRYTTSCGSMTPISRWLRSAGICEGPFSEEAERGLEEIADYIAKDSPRRAVSFARELRDAALALGDHPKAYPLIPRYEEYGQRRKAYRAYLII